MTSTVNTLIDLLERRAASSRGAYHFLKDGRDIAESTDYRGLRNDAQAVANQLREKVAEGSRALLLYPPGLGVLPAFFGCLKAGIVAVPVPPPDGVRLKHSLPRLQGIVTDADAEVILTTSDLRKDLESRLSEALPNVHWIATDTLEPDDTSSFAPADITADTLAYLQYTSGSTSAPRGVMLTHAHVLANLAYLKEGFACDENSVCITWMPYFHDYGLVEGLLQPMFSGADCYVLSPLTLLKRPFRWLQAIDRFGGTHTHAPNFAYELCLERITAEQLKELDLSSWRVAGNGAEPVRAETLRRFTKTFEPQGFRAETFYPAYGMAEATLFVTARGHDQNPRMLQLDANALEQNRIRPLSPDENDQTARTVVSCGLPQPGTDLRIVDPATGRTRAPDEVGEIWIASPSVALGYWRRPEDTTATFGAYLADAPEDGPFLRTGDLGFLYQGELHLTGRLKDLIVVAGVNHYPHDIEWTVLDASPDLRREHCAAFAVEENAEERLVIIAEAGRRMTEWQAAFRSIREAVSREHGLAAAEILILERGQILKTSSGKVQRRACRQAYLENRLNCIARWEHKTNAGTKTSRTGKADLREWLCQELARMLSLAPERIDPHAPFAELGLDSRAAIAVIGALEDRLGSGPLDPTLLWQYPSITALCERFSDEGQRAPQTAEPRRTEQSRENHSPIAIIGLACRLPGAADADAYWDLLRNGRCAVRNDARLPGVEAGFLDDIDGFDAAFFGLPQGEARNMDPQQRLLLEVSWHALEHAGLPADRLAGSRTGVFVGISSADFAFDRFSRGDTEIHMNAYSGTGVAFSIAANRLSYQLDLRGPSMAIDTACSSSLVAVHQACQSLRSGESEVALAGGVNVIGGPHLQLALERAGMLSPTRRSHSFAANADGYVRGEGCGMVVLKPLAAAQRDGNRVLAVIRGSAVNQDGRSNGMTAPNPQAQQSVVRDALAAAELGPEQIDFVETHGTGTRLGDPIEIGALQAVLGAKRSSDRLCLLGSAKANIGHLESAAGIAGLLKATLCLQHGEVPQQPDLREINPLINLEGSHFEIPTRTAQLARTAHAAVSSFGFGGTNAHVVLEQAPGQETTTTEQEQASRPCHLLPISARDAEALRSLAGRYARAFRQGADIPPQDLCAAAATRRSHLNHRFAFSARTNEGFAERLEALASGDGSIRTTPAQEPSTAFLFTGQGSQYLDMGRALYESDVGFRATLDRCDALLAKELEPSLLSVIFGKDADLLAQTRYTQPALFALEFALTELWMRWGVSPSALLGHSVGEYVAACVAGIFDLETGLRLISERARLIQGLPLDGAMLAVMGDEEQVSGFTSPFSEDVSVAAVNGPRNVVLSGRRKTLIHVQKELDRAGLRNRFLPVSHAFHSPLLDPILETFHRTAIGFDFASPQIPLVSNLDGQFLKTAPDADYWTRHLRGSVRFADGLRTLATDQCVFLEIGPKPLLTALGTQCVSEPSTLFLPSLREGVEDWAALTESLASLYTAGITLDWDAFYGSIPCERVPELPAYPFRKQRFPLPPRPETGDAAAPLRKALATGVAQTEPEAPAVSVDDWGFVPRWKAASSEARPEQAPADWLLLDGDGRTTTALAELLRAAGANVRVVKGPAPDTLPAGAGTLNIVCLWPLELPALERMSTGKLASTVAVLNARLTDLTKTLAAQSSRPFRLTFVSRQAFALAEGASDAKEPTKAGSGLLQSIIWGLGRSLRHEHPDWHVCLVDLDGNPKQAAAQFLAETRAAAPEDEVVWRRMRSAQTRFTLSLDAQPLPQPKAPCDMSGTWLLTGGLGRLGLLMAGWLIENGARHLTLVARSAPSEHAADRIAEWCAQGTQIRVESVDVTDEAALAALIDRTPADWPALSGILHAAGVIDDGVLHQQSAERVTAVMAPKVLGGWALHRLTLEHPVRHFMLVSSASGVMGNPGQAAYGAANCMLDALALYRRQRDLPAQSLSWSAWADASRETALAARLAKHGLAPIETEQGLEAMERAVILDVPHLAILPRRTGARLVHPLLDGSASTKREGHPDSASDASYLAELRAIAPENRADHVTDHILTRIAAIAPVSSERLDPDRGFFDQGLDSMNAIELRNRLQADIGIPLPATLAFDFPTPNRLARHLLDQTGLNIEEETGSAVAQTPQSAGYSEESIAIISLGCRIPGGVQNPDAFWALLKNGVDAISEIPGNRWDIDRFYDADPETPGTIQTRYGGFIDGIEQFDPGFFGISPREAQHLDPQQRLLLEVAWELLERAGIPPSSLEGSQTGVFIGISTNDYLQRLSNIPESIDAYLGTGNALSVAANRLSFFLGLEGPSLAIDTACSSSLVAIHQACQSLRGGETDLVISGGVNLLLDPTVSINHSRARMLAPDGRCKAFAAEADGFVRSEGCGLILLKRLADAERDGDRIMAVIRGSAVNQDGRTSGLTVPNGPAQERVIRQALKRAGLTPAQIDYVEAHGTGTALGDPIEAGALEAVFGADHHDRPLLIGSVKTNIGHLESAAGVAGLQKAVLSLSKARIPANLHSANPNQNIDWPHTGIRLPNGNEVWPEAGRARRAGVSSFGFGGTNAHVIVEQAPEPAPRQIPQFSHYFLPVSAKSRHMLRILVRELLLALEQSEEPLADLCFTASCGRDHFTHRLALLGGNAAEMIAALKNWLEDRPDGNAIDFGRSVVPRHTTAGTPEAASAATDIWRQLAQSYASGESPDWKSLYAGLPLRRVDLPGHPFDRQRYWVKAATERSTATPASYSVRWEQLSPTTNEALNPNGHWLILADKSGFGQALASELEARGKAAGVRCTLVFKAPYPDGRSLVSGDGAALSGLLEELGPLEGLVHLWSLDGPESKEMSFESLMDGTGSGIASLVPVTRALLSRPAPPRLWLVTRDAIAAAPNDRLEGLSHAPIWGFGRSIALEAPRIWGGLLDLPRTIDLTRTAAQVASVVADSAAEAETAIRGGNILVPRLHPGKTVSQHPGIIRRDASYLVTGGFGSLGRAISLWLAKQGAGRLLLISRQGANAQSARDHVRALKDHGVTVDVAAIDIADQSALSAQLAEWSHTGPALKGVAHCAGTGEQRALSQLNWPKCAAVLAGKSGGAWALHGATTGQELDFFLVCGSIAGLWGGQRQASYAAANSFLDGFAAFRRARGLTCTSLDLGPVTGTELVNEETGQELRRMGLEPFPVERLLENLPGILGSDEPQTVLVAADWARFAELYKSKRPTALFDPVLVGETHMPTQPTTGSAPRDNARNRKLVPGQSPSEWLTESLCGVLQLPPDRVTRDTPLSLLGLDSLLAMEVRGLIERELGITIGLSDLLGSHSLNDLADRLEREVSAQNTNSEQKTAWIAGQI